jgi:hypothetical protein
LDTEQPFSYCYELQPIIAWKTPPTCIPPPICMSAQGSQTALIRRAVGVANGLRNTRASVSRNGIDFAAAAQISALRPRSPAMNFAARDKVLNLSADSKRARHMTFPAIA